MKNKETSSPKSSRWPLTRFGEVVRNVNDNVRDPLSSDLERYVGLDHLDPESLHIKRWGLIADGTTFTRKFVTGQVLFGKRRAYQRKVAVAEFDGICSGDILVFEPANDQLLPELLPFIVQSDGFFEHALGTSAGSLSPRTKWQDLARYEFALPPLDEQRRDARELFAAILEAMTALREALREERSDAHNPIGPQREREAYMRQTIRAAQREGHERIAVVCGAWHAPALAQMPPAKDDAALMSARPI